MCGRDKLVVLTTSGKSLGMLSVLAIRMAKRPHLPGCRLLSDEQLITMEHQMNPGHWWPAELQSAVPSGLSL